ncbi:MAG: hypothetical protein QOE64_1872 [Frankiales bacterium]|nr:hypothetical protein [Frankiales bacterium]
MTDHDPLVGFLRVEDAFRACVIAIDRDLQPVGYLRWLAKRTQEQDFDAGVIGIVEVREPYRRLGIATRLLREAKRVSTEEGWTPPRHNSRRSMLGDLWARSVGADAAAEIEELEW